jgi:CheY-like chemotaxis protein
VHDDGDLREIARDFASSLPCRLAVAASSQEAMLRLGGTEPDVILAEGTAPAAHEARNVSATAPLVLLAGIDDEWQAFQAGAVAFLARPLSIVEWRDVVTLAEGKEALAALTSGVSRARSGRDIQGLRDIAAKGPQPAAAWAQYLSALVLLSTGHLQEAVEELSALAEDHEHAWRAHERLNGIWRAAGDKAEAEIHEARARATREQHAKETSRARETARETHSVPSLALDAMDTQPEMIPVEARSAAASIPPPAFPPAPVPVRAPIPRPLPDTSITQPDMPAAAALASITQPDMAAAARPRASAPLASILVADDSELVREMIAEALTEAGYRVRTAADGRTALDLARRERPDMLILDGLMPGVHGFDVCKAVKQELYPRNPPKIVILSAIYTKQRQKSEAVTLYGADEVLSKPVAGPFDGNELIAVVKRHLGG